MQTLLTLNGKNIGHIEHINSFDEDTSKFETMLHGVVYDGKRPYTIDGYTPTEEEELKIAMINLYNEKIIWA